MTTLENFNLTEFPVDFLAFLETTETTETSLELTTSTSSTGLQEQILKEDEQQAWGAKLHFDALGAELLASCNPQQSHDEGVRLALEQSNSMTPRELASSIVGGEVPIPEPAKSDDEQQVEFMANQLRLGLIKARTEKTLCLYLEDPSMVRAARHENKSTWDAMRENLDPLNQKLSMAIMGTAQKDKALMKKYESTEARKADVRRQAEQSQIRIAILEKELESMCSTRDNLLEAYYSTHERSGAVYSEILNNRSQTLSLIGFRNALNRWIDSIDVSLQTQHVNVGHKTTRRIIYTTSEEIIAEERNRRIQFQVKVMVSSMNSKEVIETEKPDDDEDGEHCYFELRCKTKDCSHGILHRFVPQREYCPRMRQHRDLTCDCAYIPYCHQCLFKRAATTMIDYISDKAQYCSQRLCMDTCPECSKMYCPFQLHPTSLPVFIRKKKKRRKMTEEELEKRRQPRTRRKKKRKRKPDPLPEDALQPLPPKPKKTKYPTADVTKTTGYSELVFDVTKKTFKKLETETSTK